MNKVFHFLYSISRRRVMVVRLALTQQVSVRIETAGATKILTAIYNECEIHASATSIKKYLIDFYKKI